MKKYSLHISVSMNVDVIADSTEEAIEKAKNKAIRMIDSNLLDASVIKEEEFQDLPLMEQAKILLRDCGMFNDIDFEPIHVKTFDGEEWLEEENTIDTVSYDTDEDEIWLTYGDSSEHRLAELDEKEQVHVCETIVEYYTKEED